MPMSPSSLRKQLVVLVVFTAVMAAITALSYVVSATTDTSDCLRGFIDNAEACR
jgi:hypothetical protein